MGFQHPPRTGRFPWKNPASRLRGRFCLERPLKASRTDLAELMLSSTGRLSRAPFLACAALLLAIAMGYRYGLAGRLAGWAGWVVYPLILFPFACITSKRLHDRGRAGWWGFLIVWALIEAWPAPRTWFGYAGVLVLVVTFLDLGLLPGVAGRNRFGPNPREA